MQAQYLKTCFLLATCLFLSDCANVSRVDQVNLAGNVSQIQRKLPAGMPLINPQSAIYEVPVQEGVSYQDVVDSLKSISEGMNFVNPANFPIGDHMQQRGQSPVGVLEVRAFCNLSLGADIMQDHPEFVVFAPCRIAVYEKLMSNKKLQLYIALARPTYDLQSIQHPSKRAIESATQLEIQLIQLLDRARRGDF